MEMLITVCNVEVVLALEKVLQGGLLREVMIINWEIEKGGQPLF